MFEYILNNKNACNKFTIFSPFPVDKMQLNLSNVKPNLFFSGKLVQLASEN